MEAILAQRHLTGLDRVSSGEPGGRSTASCELVAAALARAEALDGYDVLETTRSAADADATTLLTEWQGQWQIEQRHRHAKGPLRIRPRFMTSNQRIVGLITILGIALMVFSLIERAARRTLGAGGKLPGLLAGHVAARPTGANILRALREIALVRVRVGGEPHQWLADLTPLQRRLLARIHVPEAAYARLAS